MAVTESLFRVGKGFSIDGETEIIRGTIDPSSTGYAAPISSVYIRDTGSDSDAYLKTGATDTDWEVFNVGSAGSTEDGFIQSFIGKTGNGSESPTYSSTDVVTQSDNLEVAVGKLDAAIGTQTYTEDNYVIDGQDITASIDALDQQVKDNADAVSAASTEEGHIQTFIGKTADGSESPTYSSTDVVTQSDNLEVAVGKLDAAIGTQTYTEDNYVTDGQDVTASVDALDQQVKDNADNIASNDTDITNLQNEEGFIQTFIGKTGDGSESPTYSSTDVVTQSDNLEVAVGKLDAAIGTQTYTEDNYVNDSEDVTTSIDALDQQVKDLDDQVTALQIGYRVIEKVLVVTGDDISAKSGTAVTFSDDNTGGVSLTAGDRIASTNSASNDTIYVVQAGSWTTASLAANDAFYTSYDLPDVQHQERTSLYMYDGTDITEIADFDSETADTIAVGTGYSATNGNISSTDTVQTALERLDGNQQDVTTTIGMSQGDTDLGTFTGAVIADNSTVKAAIQAVETDLDALQTLSGASAEDVNLSTFTGSTISDNQTIKAALQDLETALEETDTNADDLVTLSGVAENSANLGAFTGTIIPDNQTVKQALQALETDADAIQTSIGTSAEDTNLGTFTGATISDNQTVKAALQDVETAYEETDANVDDLVTLSGAAENATNLGTFTGDIVSDNRTVKEAIQDLETEIESNARNQATQTNITTETVVDTVVVDDGHAVEWKVVCLGNADAANKETFRVVAIHDGKSGADASNVTYSIDSILQLNTDLTITVDVDLNGTGVSQAMRLKVTATTAADVTVEKRYL